MSDDNFTADYLEHLGLDEEERAYQQEMQQAANEDLRKGVYDYYIPGGENLQSPEGRADVQMFLEDKGQEEFANKAVEFGKDTVENAFQGTVKAGHAMDDFLRNAPIVGPAYSMYANSINDLTGADGEPVEPGPTDFIQEPLQQMTLAVDEWYRELEKNDSANDKMAQEFFQYVIPFTTYLKAFQGVAGGSAALTGGQQAAAAVGADTMTSWTALEPHFARFSQFLTEFETTKGIPMIGRAMEYIASTDGTDAEERLKNIGDSLLAAGLGAGVVGGLVGGFKLMRNFWRMTNEGTLNTRMPGQDQRGMVAYHGSPHKFDKFSMDKIGTGEGAQAYGHGLYFAENRGVAGSYRDQFAGVHPDYLPSQRANVREWWSEAEALFPNDKAKQEVWHSLAQRNDWRDVDEVRKWAKRNAYSEDAKKVVDEVVDEIYSPAHLYEVDIPDEAVAKMLDWDAPLSEQPKAVKEIIFGNDLVSDTYQDAMQTGGEWYRRLQDGDPVAASEYLNDLGIPGIKYFDGNSRGAVQTTGQTIGTREMDLLKQITEATDAGDDALVAKLTDELDNLKTADQPTRNLVVFDENLVSTLSRNGEQIYPSKADVHPDSLLPQRQLSDRIDAGEQVTAKDYFTREPEGELEQAIFQAIDDAASGKSLTKKRGKEVPIGAPRGSTSFQQAVAKIPAGTYDGEKFTKKAIKERASAMVEDGTILRPEKQMADEIIFNVTKDLDAGAEQRSAVQSAIYGDGAAPVARKRDVGEAKFRGEGSLAEATESTIASLSKAEPKAAAATVKAARQLLADQYETKTLLKKNKKLLKTEQGKKKGKDQGEEGKPLEVEWMDGSTQKVETTGLSLMQSYREGKVAICAKDAACKDNCLGYFTGGNFQYGGGDMTQRIEGPRRAHFMATQAFLRDPEAFITVLDAEIKAAAKRAANGGNKLGVRLNTLSDIPPPVYESLIRNNPDVMMYDYTKLGSRRLTNADGTPLANHHLTYSATGINHPHQNWNQMTKVLDRGDNITMVFTTKEGADLPKFVFDEKSGKRYEVVDGDTHDYRPADATADGVDGVVVGLRNKDARNKGKSTAEQVEASKGFAVPHDGEDVVNIPEQFAPKRPKGQEGSADVGALAGVTLPSTWFLMQYPHLADYEPELYAEITGE